MGPGPCCASSVANFVGCLPLHRPRRDRGARVSTTGKSITPQKIARCISNRPLRRKTRPVPKVGHFSESRPSGTTERMNLRRARALALVLLAACGPSIEKSTERAEAAAARADRSATRAQQVADQAFNASVRALITADQAERDSHRANDAVSRLEAPHEIVNAALLEET